jgi:hypothetical protein
MTFEVEKHPKGLHVEHIKMKTDDKLDTDIPQLDAYPCCMYIVGSAGSGKTNLLINCIKHYRMLLGKFHRVYMVSPSAHTINEGDAALIPKERLYTSFSKEQLAAIMEDAQQFVEEREATREEFKKSKKPYDKSYYDGNAHFLLILDDCIADINRSKEMTTLVLNRRHTPKGGTFSLIILSQKFNELEKVYRKNLSHMFLFNPDRDDLETIHKEKIRDMKQEDFVEMVGDVLTDKHDFLYIASNAPKGYRYYRNFDHIKY